WIDRSWPDPRIEKATCLLGWRGAPRDPVLTSAGLPRLPQGAAERLGEARLVIRAEKGAQLQLLGAAAQEDRGGALVLVALQPEAHGARLEAAQHPRLASGAGGDFELVGPQRHLLPRAAAP